MFPIGTPSILEVTAKKSFSKILKYSTLVPASSNEVPQGEIWVDKYIKDSYLKHEQTVHYEIAHQHQYQALLA